MNLMKNMKIGTKILGLVAILIVMMATLAGFGILKLVNAGDEVKALDQQEIAITATVNELSNTQVDMEVLFERAIRLGITNQPAELLKVDAEFGNKVKEAEEQIIKVNSIVAKGLKEAAGDAASLKELQEVNEKTKSVEKEFTDYEHVVTQVLALIKEGKMSAAAALEEKAEKEGTVAETAFKDLIKLLEK